MTMTNAAMSGVEIRLLKRGEEDVLSRVAPDVFDLPVQPDLVREYLAQDHLHLIVALDGDLVVGMASAVTYFHPDKPREFFFNELGVDDGYLRRGIGSRLVEAMFELARTLGHEVVWLGTELDNDAANGLYRAMKGRLEVMNIYTFSPDGGKRYAAPDKAS